MGERYEGLGSFLKEAREARGLTQKQVAEQLGTSPQHVIRWEKGEHRPDEYASKLAEVLGIPLPHLQALADVEGYLVDLRRLLDEGAPLEGRLVRLLGTLQDGAVPDVTSVRRR